MRFTISCPVEGCDEELDVEGDVEGPDESVGIMGPGVYIGDELACPAGHVWTEAQIEAITFRIADGLGRGSAEPGLYDLP